MTALIAAPTFQTYARCTMDALFGRDAGFTAASVHATNTHSVVVGVRADGTARAEVRAFDNTLAAKRRNAHHLRAYDVLHTVDADDGLMAWLLAAAYYAEAVAA